MPNDNPEKNLPAGNGDRARQDVCYINLKMLPELHRLIGEAADREDLPMNEYVVRTMARIFKRADLAKIPRKTRTGRPRQELTEAE